MTLNCGTPCEKVSEYLDFCLKPITQNGSSDCKNKIKRLGKLSGNITLVTVDVRAFYPSISHENDLETLGERLFKTEDLKLPVNDIVKLAEFAPKYSIFEFNGKVQQQVAGTAVGTKFPTPYECIRLDNIETKFLKAQELQPLASFRYIADIFFIWNHSEGEINKSLENLNNRKNNLKFTYAVLISFI